MAASTGPRPGGRGNLYVTATLNGMSWLQRGRARGGAETTKPQSRAILYHTLQRGRARGGAETVSAVADTTPPTPLQRGRARGGAETQVVDDGTNGTCMLQRGRARGARKLAMAIAPGGVGCFSGAAPGGARRTLRQDGDRPRRLRCFNGAAPGGARKHGDKLLVGGFPILASTGPRPGGRGNFGINTITPCGQIASTGPRPGGRGNIVARKSVDESSVSFNGAAPGGARKQRESRLVDAGRINASTGPRPGGRGNVRWAIRNGRAALFASTGPRPGGAETHGAASTGPRPGIRTPEAAPAALASTGPRPGRAEGRGYQPWPTSWSMARFNGAAPGGARKPLDP